MSGSGTAGAYHAGVLRALHEAGIKLDVMSGRGIGVVSALFAAIDAAPRTWEEGGLWKRKHAFRLYRWRRPLRVAGTLLVVAAAILVVPLLVLATGLVVYPLSFLVQMVSIDAGRGLAASYGEMMNHAFGPTELPSVVPRLITLVLAAAVITLIVAAITKRESKRKRVGHREQGQWWARLIGSPWSMESARGHYHSAIWQLFRGPASAKEPPAPELSRRYVELLGDNLGQPGFRELILGVLDLETRSDVIFALIGEDRRAGFFHRTTEQAGGRRASKAGMPALRSPERAGDLIDLAGVGRSQVFDALAAALSIPVVTEPHLIAFSPESYWKGETHRTCDRPGTVGRLLHELATAGVEQVIVVSASADRSAPHRLSRPFGTFASRLAEHVSSLEASAVRDGVAGQGGRFHKLFLIQPTHNPVGPFDFSGAYDDRSDRFHSVEELVDRGYEDAYRQFIEPIVGSEP